MGLIRRLRRDVAFARSAIATLRRVAAVYERRTWTFPDTIEKLARERPDEVAIVAGDVRLAYREYDQAANRYARWALDLGLAKGDVVALLMENRPEYLVAWLGIAKAGGVSALINTHVTAHPLAHSLAISGARHLVLGVECAGNLATARGLLERPLTVWAQGGGVPGAEDLDAVLAHTSGEALPADARRGLTIDDKCLYIYTSGTTGLPKAANISHLRLQVMMASFSAAARATARDRMYVCLPLYHTAGGVCAIGTTLTVGGSVAIRRRFSAREFWSDVVAYDATLFQYIGELCRYLLNAATHPQERAHGIRLAIGNGLRPEIWAAFRDRFGLPRILEFYGATEGNVAMMNFDGAVGAVGRIPWWAKRRTNVELVRLDLESERPVRGADGFCIRCAPGESGEAIGRIANDPRMPAARFEGYAHPEENEKKILRDVFAPGDRWFRSGDLLRQDGDGYFYFVDRIGDTFRWKGENVATSEVAEAISVFPGVKEANVYGVRVPNAEGRAGMAAIVTAPDLNLEALRAHLARELPGYSQPVFLRLRPAIEVTGTFKHRKLELVKEGFDPAVVDDPIYFNHPERGAFVRLDAALHREIVSGAVRL